MKKFAQSLVIATAAFVSVACSAGVDKPGDAESILQYVPADTPYLMAVLKPFPDDLMDKVEPSIDQMLSAYQRMIRYRMSEQMMELSGRADGAEKAAILQATMGAVLDLMSIEGMREAGITRDSLIAIYGNGILPVMRIGTSDIEKFEVAVKRIETAAGDAWSEGEVEGRSYRYNEFGEMRLVIAMIDADAVITIVPLGLDDEQLAQALGIKKPKNSMAESGAVEKIAAEYGFTDHVVSFIDVERIAAIFNGDPSGKNAAFLEMADFDPDNTPLVCREEIAAMATVAPRIVMGYTRVSADAIDTGMIVELREDIASGLTGLAALVPGLGGDFDGMFSFGFSLDLLAAREFYSSRLDALEADPYECEFFADINDSVAQGRAALAQQLPPIVYNFRGMLANVTSFEGMNVATKTPPTSVDASILVAIENAPALITMGAMMSPDLAALNLLPDGEAKPLDLPQLAAYAEQAFAALSSGGIAISFGDGAKSEAEAMLIADASEAKPFMSFSMDAQKYYEFIGNAAAVDDTDSEGDPMPEAMRLAVQDAMMASSELYERMSADVFLTPRGIEIGSTMTLAK